MLPEIDRYLGEVLNQTNADMALVSSADMQGSNILSVRYNKLMQKLPSLRIPHYNQTSFCLCTINRPIPVIIGPLNRDEKFSDHPIVRKYMFNTFVGIPIIVDEETYIGSLCIFFNEDVSHDIRDYEHISISLKKIVNEKIHYEPAN